jgi:hypothetical protein
VAAKAYISVCSDMEMFTWTEHKFDFDQTVVVNSDIVYSDDSFGTLHTLQWRSAQAQWKIRGCRIMDYKYDSRWEYYIVSYPDENERSGRWINSYSIRPAPPPPPPNGFKGILPGRNRRDAPTQNKIYL